MTYAGLYRCSGCSVTFSDPAAWREGAGTHAEAIDSTVSPGRASGTGQSFATGHMLLPRMPGEVIGYGHSEDDLKEIREAADRANRSKGRRR